MQVLQAAFRNAGIEVMYATIESLTLDGRDGGYGVTIGNRGSKSSIAPNRAASFPASGR